MQSSRESNTLPDIIKYCSLNESLELAYNTLNLPAILVVATNPLHKKPRNKSTLMKFADIYYERHKSSEMVRDSILFAIMKSLYPNQFDEYQQTKITNYYDKYRFLTEPSVIPYELEDRLEYLLRRDRRAYRNLTRNNTENHPRNNEIEALKQSPVNLRAYYMPHYSGEGPLLYFTKTKVPARIGRKIPDDMIEAYLNRYGYDNTRFHFYKKKIELRDGLIKDIMGIMFVTLDNNEITKIKENLTTSHDIEIVEMHDHRKDSEYLYNGIHIHVTGKYPASKSELTNPYNQTVEIILMNFEDFVICNHHREINYYKRMLAQKNGIVSRNMLHIYHFNEDELAFRNMVKDRIIDFYNQVNKINNR